ncbi:hypothetical protein ACFPPD_20115 [Cohnella suwonensis]|uniref:Aminotransferase class I/classII domain-containing protein n=1 Tax=Cohnella suwonensis TaxID=696072 RepID=A0ABW0M1H8_9BACL
MRSNGLQLVALARTVPKNGGLNLWIRLPDPLDGSRLLEESLRQSVSFVPGAICDPLGEMKSYIRLSFSYMNEKQIKEGVRLLREAAKEVTDGGK